MSAPSPFSPHSHYSHWLRAIRLFLILGCFAIGCQEATPEKILVGKNDCRYCRMTIMDDRFGGEILSPTGKVFTFDSIECMRNFVKTESSQVGKIYVLDHRAPGNLIPVEKARFERIATHSGPMGSSLVGYAGQGSSSDTQTLTWAQVLSEQ